MSADRAKVSHGILLLALAVGLALPRMATAQECIPSCDAEDGRYLAITDGSGLDTLTDLALDLTVRVSATEPDFTIGFHDGETGGLWDLAGPTGASDPPAPQQLYVIFADPETDGTCGGLGCDCSDVPVPGCDATDEGVGPVLRVLDGEAMPDNDWVDFTIPNSPAALNAAADTYGYLVEAVLGGDLTPSPVRNSFKVRSGAINEEDVSIEVFQQPFAFNASMPTFTELGIIYPGCAGATLPVCLASLENTTYDGTFSFFIQQVQPQCEFIVWDGDLDHGSFDGTITDDDDFNVPAGIASLPPWACQDPTVPCDATFDGTAWVGPNPPLVGINFEGVALGLCTGGSRDGLPCVGNANIGPQPFVPNCPGGTCGVTGDPPDDFDASLGGGLGAIFVRTGALTYEVWSPACPSTQPGCAPIAVNNNPSGNLEWEFFRLAVPDGGCYLDANGFPPDVDVTDLPEGVYEVRVLNLDLENLNAFRFAGRAVPEPCGPCVGQVTELTLEYTGTQDPGPIVRVEQTDDGTVLFEDVVPAAGRLTVQGTSQDGAFGSSVEVYVDGALEATILTACDGAIFSGQAYGEITIIEAISSEGRLICDDLDCIPDVAFDTDAAGAPLASGQVIDDEYAGFGMFVSTSDPARPAMVFDSANPTGNDDDLGTPNEDFAGPGIGAGGEAGQPGENSRALGNVLIISEDGNSGNPDDNAGGGTLIFDFTSPVRVDLLEILDIEESGGTVTAFDENDVVIASAPILVRGNNSYQEVLLEASGVRRLEVYFAGSGALAAIRFCVDDEPPPVCTDSVVRDDFDSQSFGNNDGPQSWAGDWVENDVAGAGPGAGNVQVTNSALRLDDYPNTDTHPSAARQVDLAGKQSATLKFMFDTSSGVDSDDAITVEASADGGATWTTLEVITGLVGQNWGEREIDITPFISAQTRVRFRVSNKYGGEHEFFYVTDVEICGLCEPPPPPTCEETQVRDDFDSQSFGNNDGANPWAGSWIENDVAGAGPASGNVKVTSSALRLGDYPDTGTHPSAARQVDLSASDFAVLDFMFDTTSGVDSNDAITVEISSDGGGSWTTLEVITGIVGAHWGMREYDISDYISSQTQVRFRVSNLYGGSHEYFYVTHVEIRGLCSPPDTCEPVMVKDKFMTDGFDGSDGTDDWSGPWEEFDTAGPGPASGNVKVTSGWLWLNDYPNTGTEPSIARQVDLSGVDQATLDLTWKTWSGVDASDAVTLEISSDGGNSYSTLHVFTGIVGGHTGNASFDITPYISANTKIRFRVSNLYGGTNEWFKVEWVTITGSCD